MAKVLYGPVKLKGSLASGVGDDLLTRDATSKEVGTASNAASSLTDSYIFVGNASNVPTGVAVTGDITITNAGVVAIATGVIVNADINASAAIALTKLAATTASRALVSDASGFITAATATATEIGHLVGVTSGVQTQIDGKQATITGAATTVTAANLTASRAVISNGSGKLAVSAVTDTELGYVGGVTSAIQTQLNTKLAPTITSVATGDLLYYNGSAWVNIPRGTNGQALYSTATSIQWNTPTINGIPTGGTANQYLAKASATDFDAVWTTLTLSKVTDVTATAAEVNKLAGATVTTAEINFLTSASANIQTQLNGKQSTSLATDNILKGVAGVATATTDLPTGITIGGAVIYRVGGSDVTLADGGTGASLADPNADRIMFWDDSAGTVTWLTPGTNLSITDTTINASGGISGLNAGYISKAASATSINDSVIFQSGTSIGIGTATVDRNFHVEVDDATSGGVTYLQRLTHTTSGTPAAGIGAGIEFEVETAAGNNEVGGTIELVSTDVTATSEDFDLILKLMTNGAAATEVMRMTSTKRLLVGNNGVAVSSISANHQFEGVGAGPGRIGLITNDSASANAASGLLFGRSRGAALASTTIVQSGDYLGYLQFMGADGAGYESSAMISAHVDGAPGVDDMPGRLVFWTTPDGSTINAERMRITAAGDVGIGTTPDRRLHAETDDATTSGITYVQRLTHTTTGTPANGIGVGVEFEVETAAANNEIGATIDIVTTDATAGSEDFDVRIATMAAGAAATTRVWINNLGLGVGATPSATITGVQPTLGNAVLNITSTASNDDAIVNTYQNKVTTTDATETTIHTLATATDTSYAAEATIIARRTGGTAGAAGDSAAYKIFGLVRNVAGTATLVGATALATHEDQAGWNARFDATAGNFLVKVTGALNNNISWILSELNISPLAS